MRYLIVSDIHGNLPALAARSFPWLETGITSAWYWRMMEKRLL